MESHEILEKLKNQYGIEISHRLLRQWLSYAIIPRPEKLHLGRGRGSINYWPQEDVVEQVAATAICRRRPYRLRVDEVAQARDLALAGLARYQEALEQWPAGGALTDKEREDLAIQTAIRWAFTGDRKPTREEQLAINRAVEWYKIYKNPLNNNGH